MLKKLTDIILIGIVVLGLIGLGGCASGGGSAGLVSTPPATPPPSSSSNTPTDERIHFEEFQQSFDDIYLHILHINP